LTRHLLVTNDFPPKVGGIQNYLWDLWQRLDPASFVVLTANSDEGAAAFDEEQAARGIRIERVPESILFFPTPGARKAVLRAVEEHDIDFVLFDPVLPLGVLGPRLGVPYGVILHGAEVAVPGRLLGTRAALARVLRGARRIHRDLVGEWSQRRQHACTAHNDAGVRLLHHLQRGALLQIEDPRDCAAALQIDQ